ncbi:MAG: hypothetical protein JWQ14_2818 [Adhaeribacter sp.]|jgi:hypothetical protein|nr:hypothetical protein [Adhaeribacter sp.]
MWELKVKINIECILVLSFLWLAGGSAAGQSASLDAGLRFQKTLNLYYENGVTLQYANPWLLKSRLAIGFNYVSSRLGSAIGTNALKQDNIFFSGSYYFRPRRTIHPFLRANAGWFRADYESEIFQNLTNSSPLLSAELGLAVPTTRRLKTSASLGYNLITGDGSNSPGTLYPLFYQLSVTWNLLKTVHE